MSALGLMAALCCAAAAVLGAARADARRATRVLIAIATALLLTGGLRGAAAAVIACVIAGLVPSPAASAVAAALAVGVSLTGATVPLAWATLPAAASAGLAASGTWAALRPRPQRALALAGLALAGVLGTIDRGRVLHWSFGLGEGTARVELPGTSMLLAATLLIALGGAFLAIVDAWGSEPSRSKGGLWGGRALMLAGTLGGVALALVLARALRQPAAGAVGWSPGLTWLALAEVLVLASSAAVLWPHTDAAGNTEWHVPLAASLAALAAAVAAFQGWQDTGSYLTPAFGAAAVAATMGLCAAQSTGLPVLRRLGLLLSLLGLLAS